MAGQGAEAHVLQELKLHSHCLVRYGVPDQWRGGSGQTVCTGVASTEDTLEALEQGRTHAEELCLRERICSGCRERPRHSRAEACECSQIATPESRRSYGLFPGNPGSAESTSCLGLARLSLTLGLLVASVVVVSVPLPFIDAPTPDVRPAERILSPFLTNAYRSFVFREEAVLYDRLAVSVTGDKLSEIYLENGKALEFAERGGARARVEAVDVRSVSDISADGGGVTAVCEWTMAGSVSPFGHRHYRQRR